MTCDQTYGIPSPSGLRGRPFPSTLQAREAAGFGVDLARQDLALPVQNPKAEGARVT